MDCDSPLNNVTKASRKRPFNVGNSSLIGNSNDNSDDILSSFGMKEQDIFKSPQICNPFGQVDSESSESFKVPQTNSTSGQSPYFQVSVSAKSKALQDLSDKDYKNEPKTPKVNNARNIIVPEKDEQQLPNLSQECRIPTAPEEIRKQEEECELKPRSLRPIGEYSTSSLDKEFQDIMQYLKDEREKDQNLFIKCSKGLRSRTESIIEGLENLIKIRYQTVDERLSLIINEFEKEWETGKSLEEELNSLRTQISSIMTNILQDPSMQ